MFGGMSNSQFTAIVGVAIVLLIGMMLFERYSACQEKGGNFAFVHGVRFYFFECQTKQLAKP
jgi:hypothetical protein